MIIDLCSPQYGCLQEVVPSPHIPGAHLISLLLSPLLSLFGECSEEDEIYIANVYVGDTKIVIIINQQRLQKYKE